MQRASLEPIYCVFIWRIGCQEFNIDWECSDRDFDGVSGPFFLKIKGTLTLFVIIKKEFHNKTVIANIHEDIFVFKTKKLKW